MRNFPIGLAIANKIRASQVKAILSTNETILENKGSSEQGQAVNSSAPHKAAESNGHGQENQGRGNGKRGRGRGGSHAP